MRNSSSANKSSLAWSAFICFLFEIIFQKSAFASSCIQHEPESIDSVAYSHHWMEARRQRDIVAGIIAVGKALRQKCNENKDLMSFDSCKSLLKPARESLKVHSDSLEYHKRFDRLYADVRVPDTSCYEFDTTKPFSVTYARSGMGRVYNGLNCDQNCRG